MLAQYAETETEASRVLYINSKDATATFGGNRADFDFTLEEPIVVPDHHSILMSVYSAEIPYSFYNFRVGVNCRLDYAVTVFGVQADYDVNGFLDLTLPNARSMPLPEGNYNAVELADYITTHVFSGAVFPLEVRYDPISLKFKFRCTIAGLRVTLGLINGAAEQEDMNEELGFDSFNTIGDPFVERDAAGLQPYWYGYTNPPPVPPGPGVDTGLSGPFLTDPEYYLFADDVCDMTNSIRSLFIRTNLSTSSILDSHIGGGFSNILCRVPINTEPGGIINIQPVNGNVHKLLLKVKAITSISIRLTNQKNTTINLNGLDFDISLKLDFIQTKYLREPMTLRQEIDKHRVDKELKKKLKQKKKPEDKKKR